MIRPKRNTCVSANPTDPVYLCRPCNLYCLPEKKKKKKYIYIYIYINNKKIFVPIDPNIFQETGQTT